MKCLRRAIFTLLGIVAAVLLWRGSPRDDGDLSIPPDFTTVQYWEKWTGNEAAQMRLIVDDFNRTVGREKKIYVRYLSMSNIDRKTLLATSAGVPPDIAGLWDQQVAQYASLGAAEELDDLARSHGIGAETYLPVYWKGCQYNGKLYGLVSTPAAIALLYNKQVFAESAASLRAAGLDPNRPPRTLDELNRYAAAIDQRDPRGRLNRAGYVPLQSWYIPFTSYWFGSDIFDPATGRFLLTSPQFVKAYEWIGSYSKRLTVQSIQDYLSGHPLSNFDSPQNPFLIGALAMQQQGPWMANYIMNLKPSMSQVLVPTAQEKTLPRRTDNYAWGFAPFPSAVDGLNDVSFCNFDVLMIPRGARHKNEAFEFIAYVNRQDVSEKLNTLHCKNTQLRHVSPGFFANHPNPYIDVFQRLAGSENARGVPPVPIWPEVNKELQDAAQAVALESADPRTVLTAAQGRLQARYNAFLAIQQKREQQQQQRRQPPPLKS